MLSQCYSKADLNEEDKIELLTLQTKLDEIHLKRAKGAFVRSRAKWIEEGEKNTSYFSNLEKKRQENKANKSIGQWNRM